MNNVTDLVRLLAPLWRLRPPRPENILRHPAFEALLNHCREKFETADSGFGSSFALWDALVGIGIPCATAPGSTSPASGIDAAAAALVAAFEASTATRRYLCPLDLADTLPEIHFGPARVCCFKAAELRAAFGEPRLGRLTQGDALDVKRLTRFNWLVVEETVPVARQMGERALPFLYQSFAADMGAVDAHAGKYAAPVNAALFALLLAPLEEMHSFQEMDWRPFHIPWVHLETGDLFQKPRRVPSADTLTWEPDVFETSEGETIEDERPTVIQLYSEADDVLSSIDDGYWRRLEHARASSLFETPVEHFIVRAFFSEGIDQIMAHMTAIEAALGMRSDFRKSPGAKESVARRIAKLLNDPKAGEDYRELFEIRSTFVHGRTIAGRISSVDRNRTRHLARRVVAELVDAADGGARGMTRDTYLAQLG